MLIEVALLQRFVLLLGHPVYSLTVTLFSLLLGTGLGSMLSRRVADADAAPLRDAGLSGGRGRRAFVGQRAAADRPGGDCWPLAVRILLAVALMTPAGMVMGIPLPAGVRLLAAASRSSSRGRGA